MTNPIPADITNPTAARRALEYAKGASEEWAAIVAEFTPRLRSSTVATHAGAKGSPLWRVGCYTRSGSPGMLVIDGRIPADEMAVAQEAMKLALALGFDVVSAIANTPRGPASQTAGHAGKAC